jgi:hypothetical protein
MAAAAENKEKEIRLKVAERQQQQEDCNENGVLISQSASVFFILKYNINKKGTAKPYFFFFLFRHCDDNNQLSFLFYFFYYIVLYLFFCDRPCLCYCRISHSRKKKLFRYNIYRLLKR